ncbi:Hypothetical protein POVN_LOCUS650, partial [uncultured virus]
VGSVPSIAATCATRSAVAPINTIMTARALQAMGTVTGKERRGLKGDGGSCWFVEDLIVGSLREVGDASVDGRRLGSKADELSWGTRPFLFFLHLL